MHLFFLVARILVRSGNLWRLAFTLLVLPLTVDAAPAWLKLTSADFIVYSDAPEKQVIDCAIRYAAYRQAFREFFIPPGRSLPPSLLILFRSEKRFGEYVAVTVDHDKKTVNYTVEVDGTSVNSFALGSDRDRALQITFEFETIWTLRRLGYHVPTWMSQGAGEVLSTVSVRNGKCLVGAAGDHSFNASYDWDRFFEISESAADYQKNESLVNYLSQAWGLMHWVLLKEDSTRGTFEAMGEALRTMSGPQAITAVMGCSPREFRSVIEHHLSSFRRPREAAFDEGTVRASFHVGPAPAAEVLAQTATLLVMSGRAAQANTQLDQALALAPDLPVVKEAQARRRLSEGRRREAVQLYREAMANGSINFAAYLMSAVDRLNDAMTGGRDIAGEGGVPALDALRELRQAIRLNSGSLECYRNLGRALFVAPKVNDDAIAELSVGVVPGTEGASVRYYRSLLHWRLKRYSEAIADLRYLRDDPDAPSQLRGAAEHDLDSYVLQADGASIEAALEARDYAKAYAIARTGEQNPNERLAAGYRRLRIKIDEILAADDSATDAVRQLAAHKSP